MLFLLVICAANPLQPASAFVPQPDADLYRLVAILRDRSAEVSDAAREVDVAAAQLAQSRLYMNPQLLLGVGNIAIPPTNPEGLRLLDQTMNYGAQLSYTLEINKRGHRQERDRHAATAAKMNLAGTLRAQALLLARSLGALAAAQLRVDALTRLVADATTSLQIGEKRKEQGFVSPLESDRLHIEVYRLEQQRFAAEGEETSALADCARLLAVRCAPFSTAENARAFLNAWISGSAGGTQAAQQDVGARWDVRSLDARINSQKSATELAEAQAIPDPTIYFGYVHDRFIISGSNMNAFNASIGIPLPVFDRGQAAAQAARASVDRLQDARMRVVVGATERVAHLREALELQKKRQRMIATEMLPRATGVLRDVDKATSQGALSLADLIQARRAVSELLLAEADSEEDAFAAMVALLAELGEKGKNE